MRGTTIRYGLLSGALLSLVMTGPSLVLGNRFDTHLGEALAYGAVLLSLITGIFPAIRALRKKRFSGTIPFKPAFSAGILVTLIASTCLSLSFFIPISMDTGKRNEALQGNQPGLYKDTGTQSSESRNGTAAPEKGPTYLSPFDSENIGAVSRPGMLFCIVMGLGTLLSLSAAIVQRRG